MEDDKRTEDLIIASISLVIASSSLARIIAVQHMEFFSLIGFTFGTATAFFAFLSWSQRPKD